MAAAAFGALGASASSAALPEFVGALPLAFNSTLKATTLETVAGPKITCAGGVDAGQVTGAKALTVRITFTGCILKGISCRSGSTAGVIETPALTGTLGYIKAATKDVGLDLSQPAGAPFMDFTCGEDRRRPGRRAQHLVPGWTLEPSGLASTDELRFAGPLLIAA